MANGPRRSSQPAPGNGTGRGPSSNPRRPGGTGAEEKRWRRSRGVWDGRSP
ncbi:hypothetical protein KPATCC21470_1806 [Kitasatospora purpeofusca]